MFGPKDSSKEKRWIKRISPEGVRGASLFFGLLILLSLACNAPLESDDSQSFVPTPTAPSDSSELTDLPARAPDEMPTDKWALWTNGTQLRGMVLHPCRLFTAEACLEPITRQDIQEVRDLGANLINASYPGPFSIEPPYEVDPTSLSYLDNLVAWAEEVDIYVVIHFRTGPGRNEAAITLGGEPDYGIWHDQAAHDAWVEMWRFTAERYRNSPAIIGYNIMVEPHPNTLVDPDGELDLRDVQEQIQGTLLDWNILAAEATAAIRQVDEQTPIIINSLNWASPEWFPLLQPTGDLKTIYSFHTYDPDVYTGQGIGEDEYLYPSVVEDEGETINFDRAWLDENYEPVRDFAREHQVPIYVGEFGLLRWVPGAAEFLRDQISLFEEAGWNYAAYIWRGDEPDFDGFNLEYGPDPNSHTTVPDNPLLTLFRQQWSLNTSFPHTIAESARDLTDLPLLSEVRHWLYLIDVNLNPETVTQIANSDHDMVVLDFISSEENNTNFPMAEVIAQIHDAARPKLVLAYIDTGQAESYRTYWQPGWGVGNPEWIAGADPDGWEGNFPVAYWYDEWREIWLGTDGYLQAIIDAGFDGVYLDWVEAYSDENVLEIAERDGVDARQEMIWWVADIAEFGQSQKPDFLVIGQNAAELARHDDYLEAIDAIAQEQVWFDGGADNDPPGDCPLPRTENEVDTDAYRDSLSPACQKQYDDFPESTLHVSSEEYLNDLHLAQQKGVPIFTVDYALEPENVTWVYQTAREEGFIPFVGNRALDGFVSPFLE